MIKLRDVSKIYQINKEEKVVALDNVSLTFPEKGMVFIVGKSGSGKSTLLNMIGSLDDLTSGEIYADGNKISTGNSHLLDDYRNSYLGFVFQDYYLIDSLTVRENIALALDIKDDSDYTKVNQIIEKVGLSEQANRYPKSLSGGQQQRVAIARSIVKSPKVVLCDEPTGNLDSKTSKQIMSLLKDISKDYLVIIVSHNLDDAYFYSDRIIEISDGRILKDLINNNNDEKYEIRDDTLYVNDINDLSKESLTLINRNLKNGKVKKIESKNDLFIEHKDASIDAAEERKALPKKRISFKNKLKLSNKLNKKKTLSTIFVSIIAALLTVLLGLSQSFVSFSNEQVFEQMLVNNDQKTIAFKKGVFKDSSKQEVELNNLVPLTLEDENLITDSNYNGDYFKLYNYSFPVSLKSWQLSTEHSINDTSNLANLYLHEIYGVLPTTNSFMSQLFGNDFEYVGNLNDKDYGIIITDYIADSILYYRSKLFKNYDDILGIYRNNLESVYGYVNAIVKTNYKEKYKTLFDDFKNVSNESEREALFLSDSYLSFYEEVKNYLGIAYSLNPNFVEASQIKEARNIVRFDNSVLEFPGLNEKVGLSAGWAFADGVVDVPGLELANKEMCFSLTEFNRILNKNYSIEEASLFNGQTFKINRYHLEGEKDKPMAVIECKIKIMQTSSFSCVVSDDLFNELRGYDVMPYMFYFEDLSDIGFIYETLKDNAFVPYSSFAEAGNSIAKVVYVFRDFFALILTVLIFVLILTLSYNAFLNVKQSKYNIGILKALGVEDKDISFMMVTQILLTGLITSILFIAGLFGFASLTNKILFDSFMDFLKNPALRFIQILTLKPWIFFADIGIIFAVIALTMMIPYLMMKKIKPLNIIKKGDNK